MRITIPALVLLVVGTSMAQDLPTNSLIRVQKSLDFTVKTGDTIVLEQSYAIVPSRYPSKVSIQSTDIGIIKPLEILYIGEVTGGPPKLGGGKVGGTFRAVKDGHATITLIVTSTTKYVTTIKCNVIVK